MFHKVRRNQAEHLVPRQAFRPVPPRALIASSVLTVSAMAADSKGYSLIVLQPLSSSIQHRIAGQRIMDIYGPAHFTAILVKSLDN